jgi:hypothetical protein
MTRDHWLWDVLLWVGVIALGLTLLDPQAEGFPEIVRPAWPWLKLVAAVAAIIGAKNGNSWLKDEPKVMR